jgi:hypothetical protein
MKQLYAVIAKESYPLFRSRFPDAIDVGVFKMGVFADVELESIKAIGEVQILTYEEAKLFVEMNGDINEQN